jgi:polar amino acid transport system substrate-binding protein
MALECMKAEGVLHKLYVKWYGEEPAPGTALDTVFPGYGPPGLAHYDPAPHQPACN